MGTHFQIEANTTFGRPGNWKGSAAYKVATVTSIGNGGLDYVVQTDGTAGHIDYTPNFRGLEVGVSEFEYGRANIEEGSSPTVRVGDVVFRVEHRFWIGPRRYTPIGRVFALFEDGTIHVQDFQGKVYAFWNIKLGLYHEIHYETPVNGWLKNGARVSLPSEALSNFDQLEPLQGDGSEQQEMRCEAIFESR